MRRYHTSQGRECTDTQQASYDSGSGSVSGSVRIWARVWVWVWEWVCVWGRLWVRMRVRARVWAREGSVRVGVAYPKLEWTLAACAPAQLALGSSRAARSRHLRSSGVCAPEPLATSPRQPVAPEGERHQMARVRSLSLERIRQGKRAGEDEHVGQQNGQNQETLVLVVVVGGGGITRRV